MSFEKTTLRKRHYLALSFVASLCMLSLFAQTNSSEAAATTVQPALVTFVDNGVSLNGGLPGQKSEAFIGKLFAGNELLAMMKPARFATFTFNPGKQQFTAQTWMATGTTGGAHLTVDLVSGKRYFVELRTRESWPITKQFGIKEVTCEAAHKQHEHDRPLETEHLREGGLPIVFQEPSLPACL